VTTKQGSFISGTSSTSRTSSADTDLQCGPVKAPAATAYEKRLSGMSFLRRPACTSPKKAGEGEHTVVLGFNAVPVQGQGSCGIGITFVPMHGGAKIVGITEGGSAALHGGLKAGQVFCSVDGKSAAGKSTAELVLMITGEPGSQCVLEIEDASGVNQFVTLDRLVVPRLQAKEVRGLNVCMYTTRYIYTDVRDSVLQDSEEGLSEKSGMATATFVT